MNHKRLLAALAADARAWDRAGPGLRCRVRLCNALAGAGEWLEALAGRWWPDEWELLVEEECRTPADAFGRWEMAATECRADIGAALAPALKDAVDSLANLEAGRE